MITYCSGTGEPWTDELEDRLTFPRILAYHKHWRRFPPLCILVRQIAVGLGAFKVPAEDSDKGTIDDLKALFPSGNI